MTETKILDGILFAYSGMAVDIVTTGYNTIVLNGKEGNPLINWITPPSLMIATFFLLSVFCIIALWILMPKYNKITNNRHLKLLLIALYTIGLVRMWGAFSWFIF